MRAGFLTLKDRSKDLIISGGSNVYPREVEEVLLIVPGITEADALDAHCLAQMARFKRPMRYVFLDELPKNNYGNETHRLAGRGIGFIDMHLLASLALTTGATLWTRDKRLAAVASSLRLAYADGGR